MLADPRHSDWVHDRYEDDDDRDGKEDRLLISHPFLTNLQTDNLPATTAHLATLHAPQKQICTKHQLPP